MAAHRCPCVAVQRFSGTVQLSCAGADSKSPINFDSSPTRIGIARAVYPPSPSRAIAIEGAVKMIKVIGVSLVAVLVCLVAGPAAAYTVTLESWNVTQLNGSGDKVTVDISGNT